MATANLLSIEVVYATANHQTVLVVDVAAGSTLQDAILQSGILEQCPEIDLEKNQIGVYGKRAKLTDPVKANDRIEIYRELIIDPKEARRLRVQRKS